MGEQVRRVVLLGLGSRGDVLPLVHLGAALGAQGHEALLVTSDDYESEVREAGVAFLSFAPGMRFGQSEEVGSTAKRSRFENPVGTALALRSIMRTLAQPLADVMETVVGETDLLVTGVLGLSMAVALQRHRHCAVAHATYSATIPTADGRAYISAPLNSRRSRVNLISTQLMQRSFLHLAAAPGQELARRHGRGLGIGELVGAVNAMPTLVGTSPLLAPPALDWPPEVRVTGAWTAAGETTKPRVTQDLAAFVDAGSPPAYIGFGSAVARDPMGDLALFAEAAARAGVRLVARASDWLTARPDLGSHVHVVGTVPHEWLLPRMSAVIHHGGAGTTIAALAAGVPSSVVWHNLDQPFHARRTAELGVGPLGFAKRRLTAPRLAGLLETLINSRDAPGYRSRAAAVADAVNSEHGTTQALRALHDWRLL